jgi:hypothetical protein
MIYTKEQVLEILEKCGVNDDYLDEDRCIEMGDSRYNDIMEEVSGREYWWEDEGETEEEIESLYSFWGIVKYELGIELM